MSESEHATRHSDRFGAGPHHDHVSNCAYCPICSAIGILRNAQPELFDHLAIAARELVIAARMIFEEAERSTAQSQPAQGHKATDESPGEDRFSA